MGIALPLVMAEPLQVLGLGAGILLLKALSLYAGRRLIGGDDALSRPLAILLACGGEFAFVLFTSARSGGLLDGIIGSIFGKK